MEDGDVGIIVIRSVNVAHRVGIVPVPRVENLAIGLVGIPVAFGESSNEGLPSRCRIACKRYRGAHGVMASRQDLGNFGVRVPDPRPVVEGAHRIGHAPPGHGAGRVYARRSPEARNRFFVIEGEGPVQPAVEPVLGSVRIRRNLARPRSKIEFVFHTWSRKVTG